MMSLIMQRRAPGVLARACDLGIAMQLTNICRDVGEDARNGRIYLPRDRLEAAGLREGDVLGAASSDARIVSVVSELLQEAEEHYRLAGAGIAALPAGSRVGINAARLLYREIGRKVAAGTDPVRERAVVGKGRKLALLAAATRLPRIEERGFEQACAPEAAALVAAAADAHAQRAPGRPRWWDLRGRVVRMVEMLASFEAGGPRRSLPARPTGASSAR
jgi:phytoene synthase